MTHALCAAQLATGRPARRIGRRITLLDEVDSTNTYALHRLAETDGPDSDGQAIFAERQTAGRGRLGRSWHAPRGAALTFTVLLWESPGSMTPAHLIMGAAVAVAQAIERATDVEPVIRWPNDIYVREKKLAGILVEARACGDRLMPIAIGIGLNCLQHAAHFPTELRECATSLELESRRPIDRHGVARALLDALDDVFAAPSADCVDALARNWQQRSDDIGRHVKLRFDGRDYSGTVVDVNPRTGLLVQLDHGELCEFDLAAISRV